jgi:hypothetical protein
MTYTVWAIEASYFKRITNKLMRGYEDKKTMAFRNRTKKPLAISLSGTEKWLMGEIMGGM